MAWLLPSGNQINLQLGWPSLWLFPAAELNAGADAVFTNASEASAALIYGPNRGHAPLRKQVARWLSDSYYRNPQAIPEERLCIAGGASQNLSNILLRFTDPCYTRRIWMVEPTYFLACPVFEDCGFAGKLRGVPEDDEGIDLEFLRAGLAEAEAEAEEEAKGQSEDDNASRRKTKANSGYEKIYKHVIYVVPTFSNPSGKTMSLQHRHDLVRLAIQYDALIVSDDVYDLLYWPADKGSTPVNVAKRQTPPPPRLVDINRTIDPESKWGNTVSNGSFSKLIAPGTRVSWSEATPAFSAWLANTGATWSGGNPAHLASTFVEKMLSSGALEKHIEEKLIPAYAARYYAMVEAVQEHLAPLGAKIATGTPYEPQGDDSSNGNNSNIRISGGFFLPLTLPDGYPAAPVLAKAAIEKYELKFAYGKMFEVKGDAGSQQRSEAKGGFGNTIRLCWAFHDEAAIVDGIKRMRDLLVEHKPT